MTTVQCDQPAGHKLVTDLTSTSGDCDDNDPVLNPTTVWYQDTDDDGYSDGATITQCDQPADHKLSIDLTATSGDCNDSDPAIHPDATEVCDGIDNNCNNFIDGNDPTLVDNTPPVPVCKITTVYLGANGQYVLTQNDVYAGGTDNCGTVNFWQMNPTSVSCAHVGNVVNVLVQIFDSNGNQASCIAHVTVADNLAPVAICPANIPDVVLNQSGLGTLPANIGDGSSSDNCSVTETSPAMNLTCADVGLKTVVLTASDGTSTATANCTFNVVDNQVPVAHCPASIPNVLLDANGNGTLPANIGDGSSTDNCSVVETSPAMNFTCADVGARTVVLTASDGTNSSMINCTFNVVDNVAPAANCTTQTIMVTLNANAEYTIDPNMLNENSTDACGIQSLSASPSTLGCQQEGLNTIILTVTDVHGNSSTCNASVEVSSFLTINSIVEVPESCAGSGDGSIVVNATAGGGQVRYSKDGGANFQVGNTFSPLPPDTYNIVVKVFGVPSVCEKTATATIVAGSAPTTWYRDMDGDGYTDGSTQSGCAQPTGYVANAAPGDCDDNDPNEHPGHLVQGHGQRRLS
ncbi:MAG: putative metal-binding motif-containing protein [Saprospiraceae bacterium]